MKASILISRIRKICCLIILLHITLFASAIEFNIDGLTYDLTGASAMVLHVSSGNTNDTIVVPPFVEHDGLEYKVNAIGTNCFANYRSYGDDEECYWYSNGTQSPQSYFDEYEKGQSSTTIAMANSFLTYIVLPNTIESIGTNAFSNNQLVGVEFQPGVKTIGDYAFVASKITTIELPEGLLYIGQEAFSRCNLESIHLPKGLQSIGYRAFNSCKLKSITLPEGLQSIGISAFSDNTSLVSVTLPEGLQSIGKHAFFANTNLKEIVIPSTVLYMESGVFTGCYLLRKITYLGNKPSGWVATSTTYVPDETWTDPSVSMNDAHIIPAISWIEHDYSYSGVAPQVAFTNHMDGYSANIRQSDLHKEAGTWSDSVTIVFANESDSLQMQIPYSYTISKSILTVQTENITREYGEDNPEFKISYSGFVNGETEEALEQIPTVTTTAEKRSNSGTYTLKVSGGESQNYNFVYNDATLTVTKAPLTLKVEDAAREYGRNNPTFTYVLSGLRNGDNAPTWTKQPRCVTDAVTNSNVGQYEIRIDKAEATNYDITPQPGILSITKAPLTIKVNDASRFYGEPNPQFSFAMEGLKLNEEMGWVEEPAISTEADEHSAVGKYPITLQGSIDNPNYEVSVEVGTMTIDKRPLTVSTNNYTIQYGEEIPTFELSFEGFAEGEDVEVLNTAPTVEIDNNSTFNVGTYKLKLTGGDATNYHFIDKCGLLTINKAEQQLSWEQKIEAIRKYTQTELTATATSGLPITYQIIDGKNLANIYTIANKTYIEALGEGEITLTAQQMGNNNYYETHRLFKTISIIGNKKVTLTLKNGEQGELEETFNSGESRIYRIVPSFGYKLHSVTFNDEDLTDQTSDDGTITLNNITSNAILYVVYEKQTSDINSATKESRVRIQVKQGAVHVTGLQKDEPIIVYNLDGRIEATAKSNGSTNTINLSSDNIYVVKAGEKIVKVRL